MGIVPVLGGVLNVGGRDGDTTFPFLRSLVNGTILEEIGKALFGLALGDRSSQCGLMDWSQIMMDRGGWVGLRDNRAHLSVIDVTNCALEEPVSKKIKIGEFLNMTYRH